MERTMLIKWDGEYASNTYISAESRQKFGRAYQAE